MIIVSFVSVLVRRIRVPYTLGLIVAGLVLTFFEIDIGIHLTPELLLTIFLPGLLFEGAMNISLDDLLENIKSITLFAVVGVLLSVFLGGSVLHYLLGVPWQISFLFASLMAPTDPIAVLSIFKRLGVPKRLGVIIEGESLFNDGTGIVIFKIFLALVLTGTFNLVAGLTEFFRLVGGGLLLGFFMGYLFSRLFFRKIKDSLIKLTLTTVLAYGSYLLAEHLTVSGVISTVTAGLVVGGYGLKFLSPQTKLEIASFWSFFGFLLNSIVFLLIGVEIMVYDLVKYAFPIFIGFISVTIGRAIPIYGLSSIITRVDDSKFLTGKDEVIPRPWRHAIVWGGLHGGLSMVLALSLPRDNPLLLEWRPFLLSVTFGAVFLSLILQGTTIAWLLKRLGLVKKHTKSKDYEDEVAKLVLLSSAEKELDRLKDTKVVSGTIYNRYKKNIAKDREATSLRVTKMLKKYPEIEKEQVSEVENSLLIAQKAAIIEASRRGIISEEVRDEHLSDINERLLEHSQHR